MGPKQLKQLKQLKRVSRLRRQTQLEGFILSRGTHSAEEVVAEEGLDLHSATAGVRLGQAPDTLRLEVEAVLVSWTPALLHVRVTGNNAVVEARVRKVIFRVVLAWAAVAPRGKA